MRPLVSILIPTYNQAAFVAETVASALEQDYERVEVVVADDASTDGTSEILRQLAARNPDRLVLVQGDENLGITGNCNRGLLKCRGEFVALQGGDDVLLPGKTSAQVEWFASTPDGVLCYHDCEVFDSDSNRRLCNFSDIANFSEGSGPSRIIRDMRFSAATTIMLKKSAIPIYGFDSRLPMVSDWKIQIDTLANGGRYGYVREVLARYRRHGGNSRKLHPVQYYQDCLVTLAIIETEMSKFRREARLARARIFGTMSIDRLAAGERREGLGFAASSLRQGIFSWRFPLALGFFLLPNTARDRIRRALAGRVNALNYLGA